MTLKTPTIYSILFSVRKLQDALASESGQTPTCPPSRAAQEAGSQVAGAEAHLGVVGPPGTPWGF